MDRRLHHAWRNVGVLLAALALALRIAVPQGFMAAPEAHKGVSIVLCSGHGPVEALVDPATGRILDQGAPDKSKRQGGHNDKAGATCPFAAAAHASLTPNLAGAIEAPAQAAIAGGPLALLERPSLTPTGPPLPARGPPATI